ncbi:hypothetical protein C8R44DRAFT_939630 [Mycena epipterygia]|nr:hypothetical protein C8R44DRAFT_939630 [Mycena epipterygia]
MREFAQELVDLVIDQVAAARPNTKDIGTCGFVCRRWLPRTRMHLFSRIRIRFSRADPTTFQSFLDMVDASLVHTLSFVRSLDVQLVNGEIFPVQVERLRNYGRNETELRVPSECAVLKEDRLRFQRLLHAHIQRFGASPSLTHFELVLPSDIELRVIADLISALPFLTHLKMCSGIDGYTIMQSETVPPTDAFPPHLHTMDISLNGRGPGLFFEWLLSHSEPPIFTSLKFGGHARGESIAPVEAYLERHGPAIETLSLRYRADDFRGSFPTDTQTFEKRALTFTPRLVSLSLTSQDPATIPAILLLSSIHLVRLEVSVLPQVETGPADWPRIDGILAARFGSLQRVSFTNALLKTSLAPEIRALMPQASAREILTHE